MRGPPGGWHKYRAVRTSRAGYSFASKGEAALFDELKLLERAGEIELLQVQCQVELSDAKIIYKPDFKIRDVKTDETIWIEFKGFPTPEWRIKRKLWIAYGPGKLRVYMMKGKRIYLHEEIGPSY